MLFIVTFLVGIIVGLFLLVGFATFGIPGALIMGFVAFDIIKRNLT